MPSTVSGSGFLLISGSFIVEGLSPDGDTVAFKPDHPDLAAQLENSKALVANLRRSKRGTFNLRYEAIDTPETHYPAPAKGMHEGYQPRSGGDGAADANLKLLGFRNLTWTKDRAGMRNRIKGPVAAIPGYILARASDGKNGRAVSFVYTGRPPRANSAGRVIVTPAMIRQSVNYQLLLQGWAYPTFYEGLFGDLRDVFAQATRAARQAKRGVWKTDRTRSGFDYGAICPFPAGGGQLILPKLFRRLYLYSNGRPALAGFSDWLRKHGDVVRKTALMHKQQFGTYVTYSGGKLKLTVDPETLIFDE